MKKGFIVAFLAFSMAAMAQTVTPLSVELSSFNLDSLRTLYITEPAMYRASLEVLEQSVNRDMAAVTKAKKELKDEQAHAKELTNALKAAGKMVAKLKSLYGQEEKELKSMQKTVEKQQKAVGKYKELNQETREGYQDFLRAQDKGLSYSLRDIADRQRAIADLEASVQKGQTRLQTFQQEIAQKAADLNVFDTQLKTRMTTLKNEQKAAKKMQ